MPPSTTHDPAALVRTWEMVEWLREKLEVPEELGEAILGVWVWALRYAALNLVHQDPCFPMRLLAGKGEIRLSAGLAPPGWRDEDLRAQLTLQTGLPDEASQKVIEEMAAKLRESDGRLFEPVGQLSAHSGTEPGFTLLLLPDFLEPTLDDPPDLGQEKLPEASLSQRLKVTLAAMKDVLE